MPPYDDDDESGESDESDEEMTLAAFTTRGTKGTRSPANAKAPAKKPAAAAGAGSRNSKPNGKHAAAAPAPPKPGNLPLVPFVGKVDLEDVELCDDPEATIEQHMDDTEKLLQAFSSGVREQETLIAKTVNKVEERESARRSLEKREAVEAATLAAIQTTESRMAADLRAAVAEAVADARAAAQLSQEKAVAEAVKLAEERCAEQQRLTVASMSEVHQRALGRGEEEVAASKAAFNFQEAQAAVAAALAASSELLSREEGPSETAAAVDVSEAGEGAKPPDASASPKGAGLEYF